MPNNPTWSDIAVRLALTVLAGILFGVNRWEKGRPAGLRTLLLVTLAASVAMILSNLLLATPGKEPDSYAQMDPMRLPLGILTGMGFIGAGAILRRDDAILGVTTAATLWLATVVGLCFGSGQLILGGGATAIGMSSLWFLQRFEASLLHDRRACITVRCGRDGPSDKEIRRTVLAARYWIISWEVVYKPGDEAERSMVHGEIGWRGGQTDFEPPPWLTGLSQRAGVLEVQWKA